MTARKTATKPAAVVMAEKRVAVPKRQIIQHSKLLRASLQIEQSAKNDALADVERELAHAAGAREEAREAAQRACDMACALADQRFDVIRAELDAERADIIRTLTSIEAGLAAIEPKKSEAPSEPSNVVPIAAE